jgi:hypothetical protein
VRNGLEVGQLLGAEMNIIRRMATEEELLYVADGGQAEVHVVGVHHQPVDAVAAIDDLVRVKDTLVDHDGVVVGAPAHDVAACPAVERIVAGPAVERIGSILGNERIVAVAAREVIATTVAVKDVISLVAAQENVAPSRSRDLVVAFHALDHDGGDALPREDVVAVCEVDEDDVAEIGGRNATNSRGQRQRRIRCHGLRRGARLILKQRLARDGLQIGPDWVEQRLHGRPL